jgi:hypothetical protein
MSLSQHDLFSVIKSDFCNLFSYKQRGDTMEVITSICTVTNCYVSVFISQKNNEYIVSDGAWIFGRQYENELFEDIDKEIVDKVTNQYIEHYEIKKIVHNHHQTYFYKKTDNIHLVSALVFEVAHFVAAIINAQSLSYLEVKEEAENRQFKKEVNDFFYSNYTNIRFGSYIADDRIPTTIKFNAIISTNRMIHLFMYISGSNLSYFINATCKAITNFDIMGRKTNNANYFTKNVIINNKCDGYQPEKTIDYLNYLTETTNSKPILYHGFRDDILRRIPQT